MGEVREAAGADEVPAFQGRGTDAGAAASRVGYAPIVRVDAARREIELCATSEALDAHGTIFDYAASKDAFTRWIGNVREMHERRAVGQRVEVRCDDETRRVYVRVRISRGARDTWEKVLDGTLRGASIGASNVVWRRERRGAGGRARMVNIATRYDLAELSLMDNPSNPDALGVAIVRDGQPDLTLLDGADVRDADFAPQPFGLRHAADREVVEGVVVEGAPALNGADGTADRAGDQAGDDATPAGEESGPPAATLAARQTLHDAARAILARCGCALCALALAALDPDGDGEMEGSAAGAEETRGALPSAQARVMVAALRACASGLARLHEALRTHGEERRVERRASATATAETEVAALRARVERLEAQPRAGGPAARAVETTLAAVLSGGYSVQPPGGAEALTALEALAGRLRDPQAQMAVAAEMIRLQQQG